MFTQLVQQLTRFLPQSAPSRPRTPDIVLGDAGWQAQSWSVKPGAQVIEWPTSALFPDTQPAFHGPSESEENSLAA